MPEKKILTREEFEELRLDAAEQMAGDGELRQQALDVLEKGDHYNWIHQTNWFGEPILQLPQDMFALQEIMFITRPKYVIEIGVAWGGSLLFYATLMEVLGGERIIGVDIFIPDDLRQRLSAFDRLFQRITLIEASSVEQSTVEQIKSIVGDSREVLIVLDSHHTHDHVLKELQLYAPLVGVGHYLVCADTIIEHLPQQKHRPRPWGPGNNAKTALDQFLKRSGEFEVDKRLDNKLLLTCNPGGYLVRRRE